MHPAPIVRASAGEDMVDALTGDLLAIDVAKPSTGQPETRLLQPRDDVDQADARQELRHAEGIEIGPGGHAPAPGGLQPIVEEFTLSLRHQLSSKSSPGQHRFPPSASRNRPRESPLGQDYVQFGLGTQVFGADS